MNLMARLTARLVALAAGAARDPLPLALLMGLAAVSVNVPALAQVSGPGFPLSLDQLGVLESASTNNFSTGRTENTGTHL